MIRHNDKGEIDEITGQDAVFEMLHDKAADLHIGDHHVHVCVRKGKLWINNVGGLRATTLAACKRCSRGERPRFMVAGYCRACARVRLEELEGGE